MNTAVDRLAISIFKKPISECDAEALKHFAHQYPWFGTAQLLYAKKLQTEDQTLYEDQVQKTSLYFPNRLWLQHLLNDNSVNNVNQVVDLDFDEIISENDPDRVVAPPVSIEETIEEPVAIPTTTDVENVNIESPEVVESENSEPVEEITDSSINLSAEEEEMKTAQPEALPQEPVTGFFEPVAEHKNDDEDEYNTEEEHDEISNEESEVEVGQSFVPDLPMNFKLPQLQIEPANAMNAPLTFEPYHTVDYFASQGINFKEDDKPIDRFGRQLKSFTEWLKTMKRLPATEITEVTIDPVNEKKVEQMAQYSLAERHIITEAMAEVWIKQGDKAKAEEIYRKLSLLDPPKTAYFAAKIEDLKKS